MFFVEGTYREQSDDIDSSILIFRFTLPILTRLQFTDWFSLEAGPQVSVRPMDVREFTTADVGLAAGTTFTILPGFDIRLRYMLGLLDNGQEYSLGRSSIFQFGLGYSF